MKPLKTILLTAVALIAFAGNSVLCRLALGEAAIDAASFSWIRLFSGVVVLTVILLLVNTRLRDKAKTQSQSQSMPKPKGSWAASFMLLLYVVTFSYAYISLDAGIGALLLFAAVQITMIGCGLKQGNTLTLVEWLGLAIACSGLVYLMLPGTSAPPLVGVLLMLLSGVAWGGYSLAGRGSQNALSDTTFNFIRTLPFLLVLVAVSLFYGQYSQQGVVLAIVSGGLTSGVGYAIWYAALRGLTGSQAAVLQLLVPVIAIYGGVLFINESVSQRLLIATVLILGGILAVIMGKLNFEHAR